MNGVTASLWASARRRSESAAGRAKARCAARPLHCAGRGRSRGSVRSDGAPARRSRQWPISAASTSPESQRRCQMAKSAYWIGSSGSGDGSPAANAG